jgi:hypothetical protein
MAPLIVLALVFALAVLAVVVFVAVVVGIRSEPRYQMATRPQRPLAALIRRLLGVYVGKPSDAGSDDNREECLTGSSTDWWNKGGWDR